MNGTHRPPDALCPAVPSNVIYRCTVISVRGTVWSKVDNELLFVSWPPDKKICFPVKCIYEVSCACISIECRKDGKLFLAHGRVFTDFA